MNWITTAQAAKQAGVGTARIKALLAQHRIPGAKKHGPVWLIPENFTVSPSQHRRRELVKIGRQNPPAAS